MDWTETQIDELKRLWAAGHSMAAIGVKLGCSKNAIAGKRNRLGLPERGSPIAPDTRSAQAAERRAANLAKAQRMHGEGYSALQIGAQLGMRPETVGALLRGVGLAANTRRGLRPGAGLPADGAAPCVVAAPRPVAPVAAHPLMRAGAAGCRWPMGEPRKAGFRYCEAADVVPGRPYCRDHCRVAYVAPLIDAVALAPRGWAA